MELEGKGDLTAAIAEYKQAIKVDPSKDRIKIPDLATEHCSLAIALRKHGESAKAQEHLQQAYLLHTDNSYTDACEKIRAPLSDDPKTQIARADQLFARFR